ICSSRASLDKLRAYEQRMGWGFDWVSTVGPDFHRDLGFLYSEDELKPFLEGEIPPAVEQNAKACGVDAGTYVTERPGLTAYGRAGAGVGASAARAGPGRPPATREGAPTPCSPVSGGAQGGRAGGFCVCAPTTSRSGRPADARRGVFPPAVAQRAGVTGSAVL